MGAIGKKIKLDPDFIRYRKLNPKCIRNLNANSKILEEKCKFFNLSVGKSFLTMTIQKQKKKRLIKYKSTEK